MGCAGRGGTKILAQRGFWCLALLGRSAGLPVEGCRKPPLDPCWCRGSPQLPVCLPSPPGHFLGQAAVPPLGQETGTGASSDPHGAGDGDRDRNGDKVGDKDGDKDGDTTLPWLLTHRGAPGGCTRDPRRAGGSGWWARAGGHRGAVGLWGFGAGSCCPQPPCRGAVPRKLCKQVSGHR